MFAKTIIDSDAFLDMPLSTQSLYFHLSMRADDDGFINNPKKIQRMIGASDDDLKLLIVKNFIIPFESGIVVIKHWKIHNYIQSDRYKPTVYQEEREQLEMKKNKAYTLSENIVETECIQNVYSSETQVRLGKDRIGKDSIVYDIPDSAEPETPAPKKTKPVKHKYGEYKNVLLSDDEMEKLKAEYPDYLERIERLSSYVASTGKSYKSHYATIRNWARKDAEKPGRKEIVPSWMKKNQFNNFPERDAGNMDDLEAALLGAPKTAANDEEIRRRAEALKQQFGGA
jgi:hypothetical protein